MINTDLSIWAEIDIDAIENNFRLLSEFQGNNILKLAVLKADAYGHGASYLAKILEPKVDFFGVARIEEAIELRRAGVKTKILILGHTPVTRYDSLIDHGIIPTVYNISEAESLNEISLKKGTVSPIHIAVDTGMSRIGFSLTPESIESIKAINAYDNVNIEGIFSHLANADDLVDVSFTEKQREGFASFVSDLSNNGIEIPIKHLYNSAGICSLSADFDMIRMGICLYGNLPDEAFNVKGIGRLTPVMSLYSKVIHLHEIQKGTPVGYNCTFVADKNIRVATVSAGYADGYPRLLSNNGSVIINGKKARIIGRICMDQLMCDVTDIDNVKVGTTVTLFGKDGDVEISALDVGKAAGTNSYEILCGISKRVPRVYVDRSGIRHIHYGIN